jgi:hypothetical protein
MGANAKKKAIYSFCFMVAYALESSLMQLSGAYNLLLVYLLPFKAKLQYSANVFMQIN